METAGCQSRRGCFTLGPRRGPHAVRTTAVYAAVRAAATYTAIHAAIHTAIHAVIHTAIHTAVQAMNKKKRRLL